MKEDSGANLLSLGTQGLVGTLYILPKALHFFPLLLTPACPLPASPLPSSLATLQPFFWSKLGHIAPHQKASTVALHIYEEETQTLLL